MAKKKKTIELSNEDLEFTDKGTTYKLIRFRVENMTLDVVRYENNTKIDTANIPFAHLPKNLKKILKPN
ncbi:hypothetical protein [Sulfurimonas sp.]